MSKSAHSKKGFTLVELLVVITIMPFYQLLELLYLAGSKKLPGMPKEEGILMLYPRFWKPIIGVAIALVVVDLIIVRLNRVILPVIKFQKILLTALPAGNVIFI